MKVAISTNDEKDLTMDHFGEGRIFLIYEITSNSEKLIGKIENTSPKEDKHGSITKARGVISLLSDIPILLGYQFGPNIIRIKDKFLPIVSREKSIKKNIKLLKHYYNKIYTESQKSRGNAIVINQNSIKIIKVKDTNTKDF